MPRTKRPNNTNEIHPAEDFPLLDYPPYQTLTPNQRRFLHLYWLKPLKRYNNADIYRRAYSVPEMNEGTAYGNATELLRKPKLKVCLRRIEEVRLQQLDISAEKIVNEECAIAFSDVGFLFDEEGLSPLSPSELPAEVRKAVSGVEVKIKPVVVGRDDDDLPVTIDRRFYKYTFWNKGQALERLSKIKGLFAAERHRHEHSGPGGGPIETRINHGVDLSSIKEDDLRTLIRIAEDLLKESEEEKTR